MYLYKGGTQSSVLINQGVLISEVSFRETFHCSIYSLIHIGQDDALIAA